MKKDQKIVLHVCCGICALWVIKILKEEFATLLLYFYNPNIYPHEEYEKRKEVFKKVVKIYQVPYLEGPEEREKWFEKIKGFENEPEGGKRCLICYRMRLEKTAALAKKLNYPLFTTTLTISPHKKTSEINQIGKEVAQNYGVSFLERDFKKKDGFKKTIEMAKKYKFYRQNYCGCIFSMKNL